MQDGLRHPDVATLASFGAFGTSKNVARDLQRFAEKDIVLPKAVPIAVPCVDSHTRDASREECHVFLPHEMFASLSAHGEFVSIFQPEISAEFLANIRADDPHRAALAGTPGWEQATLPCTLHGDGVEFENDDSLMVLSWSGLFAHESSMNSNLLLAACPKSCTPKRSA